MIENDPRTLALKCQRCGVDFIWRCSRPITPAALLHKPLYCPPCRRLVGQYQIVV